MSVEAATSRILVNAIIGATKRDPDWTDFLYHHGWRVSQIEADYLINVGEHSAPLRVTPDLALHNEASQGLLILEFKLGAVDPLQRDRYAALSLRDAISSSPEANIAWHQVLYCTTESHRDVVEKGLIGTSFPLVVFASATAVVTHGEITDAKLHAALSVGIPLFGHMPTSYLRLDESSSHLEVCLQALAEIFSFVIKGKRTFIAEDLCRATFDEMYEYMGGHFRTGMLTRIKKALATLAKPSAMGEWLTWKVDRWVLSDALVGDSITAGVPLQIVRNRVESHLLRLGGQEEFEITHPPT